MAKFPIVGYSGPVNLHWGSANGGSDLFAPVGATVVSIVPGIVQYAGWDSIGGNTVQIKGADGLTYYYAHLNKEPLVKPGQTVTEGQQLGEVGATGNAAGTGSHLHLGIGYGIQTGTGPTGGVGIGYDAVGFLRGLLGGKVTGADPQTPGIAPGKDGTVTTPAPGPLPGSSQPAKHPLTYKGDKVIAVTTSNGIIPDGIKIDPQVGPFIRDAFTFRILPFLLGLLLAWAGFQLARNGKQGMVLLGAEIATVGISICWFAVKDTTTDAWAAVKP